MLVSSSHTEYFYVERSKQALQKDDKPCQINSIGVQSYLKIGQDLGLSKSTVCFMAKKTIIELNIDLKRQAGGGGLMFLGHASFQ